MQLGSVLKQIIKDKKKLVEESKNKVSLQELKIKTSVDKVFDNVILNLDNEVEIIDHRNKFKNRRFFREFDHPSEEYFEELAVQIIEKLKNN